MKNNQGESVDRLVYELKERAKELNCLYDVQALLSNQGLTIEEIFTGVIQIIPPGWQYPDICQVEIRYLNKQFASSGFEETPWVQSADILVQDSVVGDISVYYSSEMPKLDEGPFLQDERRLINTIADQIGNYLLHHRLVGLFERKQIYDSDTQPGWWTILGLLRKTDPSLLIRITRKMINFLCWNGVKEAEQCLKDFISTNIDENEFLDQNFPFHIDVDNDRFANLDNVFNLANLHLSEDIIFENIQQWIREDQSTFLVHTLVKPETSLTEISGVLERYHQLSSQGMVLTSLREKGVRTALIRRLMSENQNFLDIAKKYISVDDFRDLFPNLIFSENSHGKLGGKGSGIFLATKILELAAQDNEIFEQVKTPKTWYIVSDAIFDFIDRNNLEDILLHKYLDIGQVRQDYPYIVHTFKNTSMPPKIVKELSLALDDLGDVPLIVRSSSLLEDQVGMSFAGKYKSLFIANKGTKKERLDSLCDAIAEVYASQFGPDPIEYRVRHGILDLHEEMGILIQEVVGTKVGCYFLPAYAGVAFSHNEFRWSSRIKREDGLIRLVPGLGTRAVDRISDDFPILIAPGKSGLRVNVSIDEIIRYSPKMIDVINLETGSFETINIDDLLKQYGNQYPNIKQVISKITHDYIQPPGLTIDFEKENTTITFDGLFSRTPFLKLMSDILSELEKRFDHPVDIEFACDGKDFYLLQCRSQSYQEINKPAFIPNDIPLNKTIFTAERYIPNGIVQNIKNIVYIDPDQYGDISDRKDLLTIGRIVGRLNQILPQRQFVLMGPGRWGSRGDIKLGVNVTYSDINNTAVLIEIATKRGDYVPELSFGTHFFQDLVEASIRYLPLYPDDFGIIFNRAFLTGSKNQLDELLPDFRRFSNVVHVIDIPKETNGQILRILMNSEVNKAVAILSDPSDEIQFDTQVDQIQPKPDEEHWSWRLKWVEQIASYLDPGRFGVHGFYIFGSTKKATAGPESDIDILIHFQGTEDQRQQLLTWLEGWNHSLTHLNYLRTGHKIDSLMDIHLITDEDIENRTSYAVKIGSATDPARPMTMGTSLK